MTDDNLRHSRQTLQRIKVGTYLFQSENGAVL